MKIIHSKKIFIQVKNGLSPRANSTCDCCTAGKSATFTPLFYLIFLRATMYLLWDLLSKSAHRKSIEDISKFSQLHISNTGPTSVLVNSMKRCVARFVFFETKSEQFISMET